MCNKVEYHEFKSVGLIDCIPLLSDCLYTQLYQGSTKEADKYTYLIFVLNAVNGVHVKCLFECKKFQKNEKITVLGSVYIEALNVLFYTKCAILHRYQCFILHLVFDFTLGV